MIGKLGPMGIHCLQQTTQSFKSSNSYQFIWFSTNNGQPKYIMFIHYEPLYDSFMVLRKSSQIEIPDRSKKLDGLAYNLWFLSITIVVTYIIDRLYHIVYMWFWNFVYDIKCIIISSLVKLYPKQITYINLCVKSYMYGYINLNILISTWTNIWLMYVGCNFPVKESGLLWRISCFEANFRFFLRNHV